LTTFLGIECLTCQLSQELIFKLTTIFSTLQAVFPFLSKRLYVQFKTHLRLRSNVLAFFSCLLFMQKIRAVFFTLHEIDNFVKLISFKCSIFNK
ncbi:hypothetical protein, partial [Phocaeicola plebeius]|uniref:hypothetical protein n=1 Tax=Phocaeicola plebeius TaxID=310297 RepID=UPI0026EE9CAC